MTIVIILFSKKSPSFYVQKKKEKIFENHVVLSAMIFRTHYETYCACEIKPKGAIEPSVASDESDVGIIIVRDYMPGGKEISTRACIHVFVCVCVCVCVSLLVRVFIRRVAR